MLSNYVLVPAAALALLMVFRPQPLVAAGVMIVAVCPGAPYGPPFTALARGNVSRAVGLMVLLAGSAAFYSFESKRVDVAEKVRTHIVGDKLTLDPTSADLGKIVEPGQPLQLSVLYAYGKKQGIAVALSNNDKTRTIEIAPLASDKENAGKPLEILRAQAGPVPTKQTGIIVAICLALFITFFSVGPGVCVWLALSELMPTRIRSVGMGVALLINQGVATGIAAFFLPIVGNYGYFAMFGFWAGCTVIYFITAAFFLPDTKGKTLEEIEEHFEKGRK